MNAKNGPLRVTMAGHVRIPSGTILVPVQRATQGPGVTKVDSCFISCIAILPCFVLSSFIFKVVLPG